LFTPKKRRSNPPIRRAGSKGWAEGLNTLAHPSTLKDTELSELINGIYSQYGSISKRLGSQIIGQAATAGTEITQLTATYNVGGTSRLIRISDAGKPEYYNFGTEVWVLLTATAPAGYAGSNPTFTSGTPTFDTTTTTWIVQLHDRLYFANAVNELIYLEGTQWYIYDALADPTDFPTIAKTGTGTGTTRFYYQYVWYNAVGNTLASTPADPDVQATGTGWIQSMPPVLDTTTYLTVTVPAAPAGAVKTGIFRSNRVREAFFLDFIEASQTTFVDKGETEVDIFAPFPEENTTKGYHFYLLDTYRGSMIGTTVELGKDTLVWGGAQENFGSFGLPDGAGYFPYRKGEGTNINAIKTYVASNEDSVFIFKDDVFGKFQFVTASGDFLGEGRIQDVNISVGSISPFSPHLAGNNLRFWSRDGAATVGNEANYGTILRYSVLSLRADAIVSRITAANLENVCGVYYKHLSLFGISTGESGTGNNAVLAFDERYNAWSLFSGLYPKLWAKYINPTDKIERLYYGSVYTADVVEMFKGKTDYATSGGSGTAITLSISTKQYDMNLPDQFKRFDKATLVFGVLTGNNTTVGVIKANQKGIVNDSRLLISQEAAPSGFGNDEWGDQEIGMMTEDDAGSTINLRYINLKQKDLFWVKFNIQNDGVTDEVSLMGLYIYYSTSNKPLPFETKLTKLATA
jgi:hypothetical protein